jgi:hypothetical protein
MTYFVQTTKSYTLVLSGDGKATLSLSDDIMSALAEKSANGTSADDMTGLMLDLMGEDAAAYLSGLGAAAGLSDDLAAIHAKGGIDALAAHLKGLADKGHDAFSGGAFQTDPNAAFSSGLFERMGASDALAQAFGSYGVTVSGDDKTDGVLLDALMESQGTEMWTVNPITIGVTLAIIGVTLVGIAVNEKYEAEKANAEKAKTMLYEVDFLPEDPTGEGSDMTLAEALAQRSGSDPGTDPWTQPSGPVDEEGDPLDPLDAHDLDQTTMPVDPVGDHVAGLGPDHLADHLDPWINPGPDGADEFRFVDGLGDVPDNGLTFFTFDAGPVAPTLNLGVVAFDAVTDLGMTIAVNPVDQLLGVDEMIF